MWRRRSSRGGVAGTLSCAIHLPSRSGPSGLFSAFPHPAVVFQRKKAPFIQQGGGAKQRVPIELQKRLAGAALQQVQQGQLRLQPVLSAVPQGLEAPRQNRRLNSLIAQQCLQIFFAQRMIAHEKERAGGRLGVGIVDRVAREHAAGEVPGYRRQVEGHEEECLVGAAAQDGLSGASVENASALEGNAIPQNSLGVAEGEDLLPGLDTG